MKARKLILSIFACGAVALTFSTTTYAWFRIGSSGYVSNLDFKVISGLGFKIAADGSDSSYYTDTLDSRMMKAAIVHGYNPDKYVFYKNDLYEYTPTYETRRIDNQDTKVLVEENFRMIDPYKTRGSVDYIKTEEMDSIINNIKLDLATTMVNKGNSIESDCFKLYNEFGDEITDRSKFLEFDLYFKTDSDLATDNQHFGIYLSDDKTYNPYGDSRRNEEGGLYEEAMEPTKITSSLQSVKLFNTLKYLDKDYNEIDLKAEDEIKVSITNAMRFSTKDNGEITVTPKSENQSANTYKLDDNNSFTVSRPEGAEVLESILPDLKVTIGEKTNTQARIYEIAGEGNLGSYATNYSGTEDELNRLYNSDYSAMMTYLKSTNYEYYKVTKPLDYESLNKMYEDGLIYDSFKDSQILTVLDSGLKAHKITFRFWLEGYDADYFAGVSGLESLSCNLSFKVNSKYN